MGLQYENLRRLAIEQMYLNAAPKLRPRDSAQLDALITTLPKRLKLIQASPMRREAISRAVATQLYMPETQRRIRRDPTQWRALVSRLADRALDPLGRFRDIPGRDDEVQVAYLVVAVWAVIAAAAGTMAAGVAIGAAAKKAWDNLTDDDDDDDDEDKEEARSRSSSSLFLPIPIDPIIIVLLPHPTPEPEPEEPEGNRAIPRFSPPTPPGAHFIEILKTLDARPDYSRLLDLYAPHLANALWKDKAGLDAFIRLLNDCGAIQLDREGKLVGFPDADGEVDDSVELGGAAAAVIVGGAFVVGLVIGWLSEDDDEDDSDDDSDNNDDSDDSFDPPPFASPT